MEQLKTILTIVAVILVALVILTGIGFLYSLVFYVLILGVVCFASVIAWRFLRTSSTDQIRATNPVKELEKVERLLDQYKQKQDR